MEYLRQQLQRPDISDRHRKTMQKTHEMAEISERLGVLRQARSRMIQDRDAHAKVLGAPFDRDKAERARTKFVEIQILIDALHRAIEGERAQH